MTNFVGRGEREALEILKFLFRQDLMLEREWGKPGIYVQIPLPKMLTPDHCQNLNEIHQKSSVDIVIITRKMGRFAVYVNGKDHTGIIKSRRDAVRYRMLEQSGWKIIKLAHYECPELFKERVNPKSVWEVCNAILMA